MAARCALSGLLRFVWGWLTPYPAYGRLPNLSHQIVVQLRRPAQAPRRAAGQAVSYAVPVVVPDGGYALSGLRKAAEPELSNSCSTPQARAAPPGRLYPTPFPSLCRMAATPYPAYGRLLNLSYQTVAQLRRPAQAPRRRAGCIRRVPVVVPDGGYALSGLPSPATTPTSRQQGVPAASPESP